MISPKGIVFEGRPQTMNGRLQKEIRTYDILDQLAIPYLRVDHKEAKTIADCQDVDKLLDIQLCKNLFLCNSQKNSFYLLMLPGYKKFKTADLSKKLGCSRLSFAPASFMEELLDITPGSVSVLGLMNDTDGRVRLVIDTEILEKEFFGCHPCINTTSLRLKVKDLTEKFLPRIHHDYTAISL